jgi:hypothetical protein
MMTQEMTLIGSQEEAEEAYWLVRDGDHLDRELLAASGWRLVGQGRSRAVLRGPSGVAYKVPNDTCLEASGVRDNRREIALFRRWAAMGATCIPKATLYEVSAEWDDKEPIVAVEYIEADGTQARNLDEVLRLQAEAGVLDINPSNLIVRGGVAYIVDAGGV